MKDKKKILAYGLLFMSAILLILNIVNLWNGSVDIAEHNIPHISNFQCIPTFCQPIDRQNTTWALYGALSQNVYATLMLLIIALRPARPPHTSVHKEIQWYLLLLFIIAMLIQSLRLLQLPTVDVADKLAWSLMITRATVFAYVLSAAVLFISSVGLFLTIKKNIYIPLIMCLIVSVLIGYRIPINTFVYYPTLINAVGMWWTFQVVFWLINIITILNSIIKCGGSREPKLITHMTALILLVTAQQSVIYLYTPLTMVVTLVSLATGSMLFLQSLNYTTDT